MSADLRLIKHTESKLQVFRLGWFVWCFFGGRWVEYYRLVVLRVNGSAGERLTTKNELATKSLTME